MTNIKRMSKRVSWRRFFASFCITLGVIVLVAGVVYAGIRALMRPPVVDSQVVITRPASPDTVVYEYDEYGQLVAVNPADLPPEIIAIMDRRPLFYTFLMFALDNGGNADVIIVGAVDTANEELYIISVPRDTFIQVPTPRRLQKAVASYPVGRAGGRGHEGGVARMNEDMQTIFGFVPDWYVAVEYNAFVRMVNAVGGVTVNVPFHMRYDDPRDNLRINIPAGEQRLMGEQALHFARFRDANPGFTSVTDFERIRNQQQIMQSLFAELLTPRTILRIPELVSIYREHVNTDMSYREMLWFADQLVRSNDFNIHTYQLPIRYTRREGWYEVPDRDAALELINRTVNPFMQEITAEMVRMS